jgi:hypothetical protein
MSVVNRYAPALVWASTGIGHQLVVTIADDPPVQDDPDDEFVGAEPLGADDDSNSSAEAEAEEEKLARQKRENVRVDVQLPLVIRMQGREIQARTRDVSATGIGFSTRLPIELEQQVEVEIKFDGWTFVKQIVIRFMKPLLAGTMCGGQFDALSEEERERLVKQVFDVQREQLRAGRRAVPGG